MFRHLLAIAGLAVCGVAVAGPSPQNSTFQVTANVPGSCVIDSTTNITFVDYDPTSANATNALDAAGSVSVRCTKGIAATVTLDQGSNPGTASTCANPLRQMASGTERLRYDIYSDSARTVAWGCDAANSRGFTSTSAATPETLQTFGRIPAGQDVPSGNYSDVVTVAVTF